MKYWANPSFRNFQPSDAAKFLERRRWVGRGSRSSRSMRNLDVVAREFRFEVVERGPSASAAFDENVSVEWWIDLKRNAGRSLCHLIERP
jgi:hypothetical protein